jgi:AraC-like DNA-binding protein
MQAGGVVHGRAARGGAHHAGRRRGTITHVASTRAGTHHLQDLARLRRVRDRIDREYAQPLDVEALARGAHMSAGHLSRQFRRAYGESPYAYLMTRRIERAMALLRQGDLSVTEVCFEVGCASPGTFSTRFTELVGVPPSAYRRDATRATAGMPPCVAKQVTRPVYPPVATPGLTDEERRTVAEMMAKGTYASINLATTDLDGTFERLQSGASEVVQEPTEQPYGLRDCAFRDPAGNLIRIQELR